MAKVEKLRVKPDEDGVVQGAVVALKSKVSEFVGEAGLPVSEVSDVVIQGVRDEDPAYAHLEIVEVEGGSSVPSRGEPAPAVKPNPRQDPDAIDTRRPTVRKPGS
jgi:hypothetical protein